MNVGVNNPKALDRTFPDARGRALTDHLPDGDPDDEIIDDAKYEPGEEEDWLDTVRANQWSPET